MQDYLNWKKSTTKNPQTVVHYERWVRRFHTFLGRETIDFTLEEVMKFREHLTTIEGSNSPKNIQFGMTLVRDYISYQVSLNNFYFPLKLLKIPQERSESHEPISYDEYLRMANLLPLNEPISLQRRLMIALLWETGMRGGELMRLKISDLRTKGAIIHNEKNHRSRLIGWSDRTEKMLKFYLPLRKQLECRDGDYLFVSFKWRPTKKLTTRQLQRIIEELRKKAGITTYVKPHSFRHGFVHRQLSLGRPITTISQMLGHSTPFNVMNYAKLTGKEIKEAWAMS